tara:strand:+ start:439 stop:816 length:378 start_codon:yes stop_codon:yes gene_type:complete
MNDKSSIDIETPWCATCKEYTEYEASSLDRGGSMYKCNKCSDRMWSASMCKNSILISKIIFPILLIIEICVPFFLGLSALISIIYITASLLVIAIIYRVAFYRQSKHLKVFNDSARRQVLKKSED